MLVKNTIVVNLSPANWRDEISVEKMLRLKQSAVDTKYISSLTGLACSYQKNILPLFYPYGILLIAKLTAMVKNTIVVNLSLVEAKYR
jgi:hypothetical protein